MKIEIKKELFEETISVEKIDAYYCEVCDDYPHVVIHRKYIGDKHAEGIWLCKDCWEMLKAEVDKALAES